MHPALTILQEVVPQLRTRQPLNLLSGVFVPETPQGYWLPLGVAVPQYPVLMADVVRQTYTPDLRLVEPELLLVVAEPHSESLEDVPRIRMQAQEVLQELLLALNAHPEVQISSEPELVFFQQAGPQRLAGAQVGLKLVLATGADYCCED